MHITHHPYTEIPYLMLQQLEEQIPRLPLNELLPPSRPNRQATGDLPPLRLERFYADKFGPAIIEALIDNGLAMRSDRGPHGLGEQLLVAPAMYRLLFAMAAEQVAANTTLNPNTGPVFTHTDTEEHFWAGHEPAYPHRSAPHPSMTRCWQADIGALLPVPRPGTPITYVLAFRERYDDERRRLIRAVGALQHELRQWNDDPREVVSALRDELADAVGDLQAAGKAAKLGWVHRAVYVSIALGAGTAAGLSEAASLGPAALAMTTAALAVSGNLVVNLATNQIAEPPPKSQRYAYLHHTQRTFPQA